MIARNAGKWLAVTLISSFGVTGKAATDADSAAKALMTISDFAGSICNNIPLNGKSEGLELNGKAQAKLNGIVKKLADLGIEGAAKYTSKEYSNVLQADLSRALKDSAQCKERVFMALQEKLLGGVTIGGNLVNGNYNVVSSGQTGGITANTVTVAPPPRHLMPVDRQNLITLPKGIKCTVVGTASDAEAFQFASEIAEFLRAQGYEIDGPNAGIFAPPVVGATIQAPDPGTNRPCQISVGSQR